MDCLPYSLGEEKGNHMWLIAALTTACCFGLNNTLFKWSASKQLSKINIQFFFYFFAFLLTLGYGLITHSLDPHWLSVLLGTSIGILNANGNIQMSRAFEKGPASLTSPLIAANAIFPVLSAGLIFHEKVPMIHWTGILIMMAAVVVIQYSPGSKMNQNYGPWILRIVLSVLSFGILGILMKTSSYLHIQSLDVLVTMYGGGSFYLLFWLGREKVKREETKIGSIVSILSVLGFSCYFYALQTGIASIVFPVVSLNCLVVVLAGCYLFKERLKLYQVFGIFAAVIGLVMTKL